MSGGVDSSVAAAAPLPQVMRSSACTWHCPRILVGACRFPRLLLFGRFRRCPPGLRRPRHSLLRLGLLQSASKKRSWTISSTPTSAAKPPTPAFAAHERIKFAALLERGVALGFDAVVTGHYAQLCDDGLLRRGRDPKDESYVLGVLDREQLRRSQFPVGDTENRRFARKLRRWDWARPIQPDSYDICFIPDGNTQAFLGAKIGRRPGRPLSIVIPGRKSVSTPECMSSRLASARALV